LRAVDCPALLDRVVAPAVGTLNYCRMYHTFCFLTAKVIIHSDNL
jgi:hypothetical protein